MSRNKEIAYNVYTSKNVLDIEFYTETMELSDYRIEWSGLKGPWKGVHDHKPYTAPGHSFY